MSRVLLVAAVALALCWGQARGMIGPDEAREYRIVDPELGEQKIRIRVGSGGTEESGLPEVFIQRDDEPQERPAQHRGAPRRTKFLVTPPPEEGDPYFVELTSPHSALVSSAPPNLYATQRPRLLWRVYSEQEISAMDLDDVVLMVEHLIRQYRAQLEDVAQAWSNHFFSQADVDAAFRPAAVSLQTLLRTLEQNSAQASAERKALEAAKNGLCDTFNRISHWAAKLEKEFREDQENGEESTSPPDPTAVFTESQLKIVKQGVKAASKTLTSMLVEHIESEGPNDNPQAKHNLKVLKSAEFQAAMQEALTTTIASSSTMVGFVQDASATADKLETKAKVLGEKAGDLAKRLVADIKEALGGSDAKIDEATQVVNSDATASEKIEAQQSPSDVEGDEPTSSAAQKEISCSGADVTTGIAPGEDRLVRSQLQAHQRKKILRVIFKSNWKSPKIKGLLKTISFKNSLQFQHKDGSKSELKADLNVNDLLEGRKASADLQLSATHTGSNFKVGTSARVVLAEAGATRADFAVFGTTSGILKDGTTITSGFFADFSAIKQSSDETGSSRQLSLRGNTQIGLRNGLNLGLNADYARSFNGAENLNLGLNAKANLGTLTGNHKFSNMDLSAGINQQLLGDVKPVTSGNVKLTIRF